MENQSEVKKSAATETVPELGMSVLAAIRERRSVRSYAPGKVSLDTIRFLLEAAVQAPSAIHEEPCVFVVVQNPDVLKRVSDRAKSTFTEEAQGLHLDYAGRHIPQRFANPDFNIFYNAGTLIIICARMAGKFVSADCWLAAENLMLAAYSMGLGTCVIGSAVESLNSTATKKELGISDDITAYVPIIVGVPGGKDVPTSRKTPEVVIWK